MYCAVVLRAYAILRIAHTSTHVLGLYEYVQWIMYFIYLHTMRLYVSYIRIYLFVCLKMKRDTYRDKYTLAYKRNIRFAKTIMPKTKIYSNSFIALVFFIFISGTEANVKRKPEQWRKQKEWSKYTQMILLLKKQITLHTIYIFSRVVSPRFQCLHALTHSHTIARAEISFFFCSRPFQSEMRYLFHFAFFSRCLLV